MYINGHRIPVRNISIATDFYHRQLGFTIVFQAEEYGWASIQRNGAEIGLYVPGKGGGTRSPGGSIDFSFVIADFDNYHAMLVKSGANVGEIIETNDGMKVFDITDPDGNEIVFRKE
ncbi:MAG: VOC family protein [Cyanobacteria bacterium P01_E01_bin.6]